MNYTTEGVILYTHAHIFILNEHEIKVYLIFNFKIGLNQTM